MDQLRSNDLKDTEKRATTQLEMPRRKFTVEFLVGLFTMLGVGATGYLAIHLGKLQLFGSDKYPIYAEFDDISGLKYGASVEIAGVPIGEVGPINLNESKAIVTLLIKKDLSIKSDDILSIHTKGIIGDRYVKVSRGSSSKTILEGQTTKETNSVVDLEDLIGKLVHNFSSSDTSEDEKTK